MERPEQAVAALRAPAASGAAALPAEVQREILRAVAGVEYGSVEVVIHNAKVVQIEVRTKKRFEGDAKPPR